MLSFKSQYGRAAIGRLCVRLPEDHQEEGGTGPWSPRSWHVQNQLECKAECVSIKGSKKGWLEPIGKREREFLRDTAFEMDFEAWVGHTGILGARHSSIIGGLGSKTTVGRWIGATLWWALSANLGSCNSVILGNEGSF